MNTAVEKPEPIHFEQAPADDGVVLRVCGEVDDFTAQELRLRLQLLRERTAGRIELDLGATTYMNSSGVAVLAQAWRAMEKTQRPFTMVKASPSVRTLFKALALERLLSD